MNKLYVILILYTFSFPTVINDGATLNISSDVSVYVNSELINNGNINNEGFLQVESLSGYGIIYGSGIFVNTSIAVGDINLDSIFDIGDLIMLIDYILDSENYFLTQQQIELCDINLDGIADISDIILLIEIILLS